MASLLIHGLFQAALATLVTLGLGVVLATYQSRRSPEAAQCWTRVVGRLFGE
jgi:hypothetical protein